MGAIATDAATRELFVSGTRDARAEAMLAGLKARGANSVFVRYLESLHGHPTADAVLAAITATLAWGPLMRKRISRLDGREPAVVDAVVRNADRRVGQRGSP